MILKKKYQFKKIIKVNKIAIKRVMINFDRKENLKETKIVKQINFFKKYILNKTNNNQKIKQQI
jgi:hypothetical protein